MIMVTPHMLCIHAMSCRRHCSSRPADVVLVWSRAVDTLVHTRDCTTMMALALASRVAALPAPLELARTPVTIPSLCQCVIYSIIGALNRHHLEGSCSDHCVVITATRVVYRLGAYKCLDNSRYFSGKAGCRQSRDSGECMRHKTLATQAHGMSGK
jgi:hypothetical protein